MGPKCVGLCSLRPRDHDAVWNELRAVRTPATSALASAERTPSSTS